MSLLFTWHATPAVKKLLGWRQGGEEEKWAEKAVDSLVKKLKKKKVGGVGGGQGTIEDLEFALANPSQHSKCVTIPKSLDGRLQVSHKKGLPHVIYCRVWRWPDLQSHQELRPVPECLYPYDAKNQHICINPYHYQRIENARSVPPPSSYMPSNGATYSSPGPSSGSVCPLDCSPPLHIPSPADSSCGYAPTASPSVCSSSYMTATSPSSALSDDDDIAASKSLMSCQPIQEMLQQMTLYWATIGYYELNTRVGELFKLSRKSVVVDGFTDPTNADARICLGLISNVNRNATIENTRMHIGRGLRLECTHEHNVTLYNLSEACLFVQSRNCNLKMNQQPQTVLRVPPSSSFVIFDNDIFSHMIDRARRDGYEALYMLQKMCFIRLSFVKGWGSNYPRHDVTSTPCWLEIQLHQPLAWIDQYLPMSAGPETDATSLS